MKILSPKEEAKKFANQIKDLPHEMVVEITNFLDYEELVDLACNDKWFYEIFTIKTRGGKSILDIAREKEIKAFKEYFTIENIAETLLKVAENFRNNEKINLSPIEQKLFKIKKGEKGTGLFLFLKIKNIFKPKESIFLPKEYKLKFAIKYEKETKRKVVCIYKDSCNFDCKLEFITTNNDEEFKLLNNLVKDNYNNIDKQKNRIISTLKESATNFIKKQELKLEKRRWKFILDSNDKNKIENLLQKVFNEYHNGKASILRYSLNKNNFNLLPKNSYNHLIPLYSSIFKPIIFKLKTIYKKNISLLEPQKKDKVNLASSKKMIELQKKYKEKLNKLYNFAKIFYIQICCCYTNQDPNTNEIDILKHSKKLLRSKDANTLIDEIIKHISVNKERQL